MFSVGDTVVYGTQGVCKIKEVSKLKLGKVRGEYYVLSPVADAKAVVYVPTGNEKLLKKMRRVLTREELDRLIDEAVKGNTEWIEDDNGRKDYCDEVVKGGDRCELMRLVGMLYLHKEDLKTQKKHFHNVDEQYLKAARRLLHDEFAYVLGIDPSEVPEYIQSRIK